MTAPAFVIAANRGELGGGEVMLLHLATAARSLGLEVTVVAPTSPGDLVEAAGDTGFEVVALDATSRRSYAAALRRWDRRRPAGLLWCNGLLPAVATSGRPDRVVHLHQAPRGRAQALARKIAVAGATATVVPSESMGRSTPHDLVLPNWTDELALLPPHPSGARPRVGYLGRLQTDKGVDVLAHAMAGLDADLVLAGDEGFGTDADRRAVDAALAPLGDRVRRLGRVPRAELFTTVDLAVFPSVWPEPFGLVAAEAMGLGVPFVVSDAGALPEVAGPQHPWIARAGDPRDLAQVISSALSGDPHAAVSAARNRWEQEFSPSAGRARFARVLRGLGYDVDPAAAVAG